MDKINELFSFDGIKKKWEDSSMSIDAAKFLTLSQVERFESIVRDDQSWIRLLEIFNKGRETDAWLAMDWPDGFDELVLCVPLCKFVDYECGKCIVGTRQENNSCANDFSLFGYISELLRISDRIGLMAHIDSIKKLLLLNEFKWNIDSKKLEKISS